MYFRSLRGRALRVAGAMTALISFAFAPAESRAAPRDVDVLVLNFDPIVPGYNGQRVHSVLGWQNPATMAAVIGFPHGSSCTESKRYETELACGDGAVEIDMVINVGKALGGDWEYVERDVKGVCDEAHRRGARVKVIFENDYLASGGAGLSGDELKQKLCQICERAGADWVKTSSGYGFVKQPDGGYNYRGATEHDLALMRASVSAAVQVKAAGGVRDLDGLIKVRDLGASRCGATATAAMLDEFRRREAAENAGQTADGHAPRIGAGGY